MEEQLLLENRKIIKKVKASERMTKAKISVVITVHNFGTSLKKMYSSLVEGLEEIEKNFEIVFVDDGSTDNSWETLTAFARNDSRIKAIRLRATFGDAAAFEAGLKHTVGEKVIFVTSRKRINPQGVKSLIKKLDEGYDLVVGWRFPRNDSILNQSISKVFNWLVKKLYRLKLHDINSGIFVARRSIFDEITVYGDMNIFFPILAVRKGYKVAEVKIEQLSGTFRQSKFIGEYIQRMLDIITVIFLMNYSKKPLHFLGFIGVIFTVAGAAMNIYLFVYRILGIGGIAGRPLLLLGALLLVIGIQMISIGLIGEIIIFTHARNLKDYSIEVIIE
jgi:glycosyltransferase involved in cell wall biosynthesis